MLKARLSVFLMDQDQGYRQVESTKPADIENWATCLGVASTRPGDGRHFVLPKVLKLSLEGLQFRLAGGLALLNWLDRLLETSRTVTTGVPSRQDVGEVHVGIDTNQLRKSFDIVDDAAAMRDRLKKLEEDGGGPCRLLAGYAWEWKTKSSETEDDDLFSSGGSISTFDSEFSAPGSERLLIDSIDGLVSGLFSRNRKRIPGLCFNYSRRRMSSRM